MCLCASGLTTSKLRPLGDRSVACPSTRLSVSSPSLKYSIHEGRRGVLEDGFDRDWYFDQDQDQDHGLERKDERDSKLDLTLALGRG